MFRKLGLLTGLLFLSGICMAGSFEPSLFYQTAITSITINEIYVSTSTAGAGPGATQVDNPQMAGRASIEIQNIDSTANLWCLAVSTAPKVSTGARKILPGSSWVISVKDKIPDPINGPTSVKFWCISDGTAFSTATVTQLY